MDTKKFQEEQIKYSGEIDYVYVYNAEKP